MLAGAGLGGGGKHTAVIGENCCITSREIKSPGDGSTEEDGGASLALMEVQPLLGLSKAGINEL